MRRARSRATLAARHATVAPRAAGAIPCSPLYFHKGGPYLSASQPATTRLPSWGGPSSTFLGCRPSSSSASHVTQTPHPKEEEAVTSTSFHDEVLSRKQPVFLYCHAGY